MVIGIISVLISLLLPALGKAREQAKRVQCIANLRSVGQSMAVYANENRGALFPEDAGGPFAGAPISREWFVLVLRSPPPRDVTSLRPADWLPPVLRCPTDDPRPDDPHSYVLNNHIPERHIKYQSANGLRLPPSEVVLMGEKKTSEPDQYVQRFPDGSSDYFRAVEQHRHGVRIGSNLLFQDLHAAPRLDPVRFTGMDPWDPSPTPSL